MEKGERYTMEYLLTLSEVELKDFYEQVSAEIDKRLFWDHPDTADEASRWLEGITKK